MQYNIHRSQSAKARAGRILLANLGPLCLDGFLRRMHPLDVIPHGKRDDTYQGQNNPQQAQDNMPLRRRDTALTAL